VQLQRSDIIPFSRKCEYILYVLESYYY
jgi:hypothetical protein